MKLIKITYPVAFLLLLVTGDLQFSTKTAHAQVWPVAQPPMMGVAATANAQRNALNNVRSRVKWLQNATRTASNYRSGPAEMLWQQFQYLRGSYGAFTVTLNPQQASYGANDWAELSAGLD